MIPKASKNSATNLSFMIEKFSIMKSLLNLENSDIDMTERQLQKSLDEIANSNLINLVMIERYLSRIPKILTKRIKQIISVIDDKNKYVTQFKKYKNALENDATAKNFYNYIIITMYKDTILCNAKDKNEENIEKKLLEIKKIYLILIYNIISGEINDLVRFEKDGVIFNLPQLQIWINNNKYKSIENLTNDECEIIAGLFYGFSYDQILQLNLSSFVKNYTELDLIIKNLPAKFQVENITQVVFRILLLNPFIWSQPSHEDIVKMIKDIGNKHFN